MAIQGTLEDLDLPGILQLLHTQSKTGTLELKSPEGEEAKVFFEKGNIVGSEALASSGKSRIGEILVRAGLVSAEVVEEAIAKQRTGPGRLGEILVKMKKIAQDDLAETLRLQIYETVYKLLGWKEGDFQFVSGPVSYDRELIAPIETEHVLMDSFRMVDEWPLIKRWISSFSLLVARTEAGKAVLAMPGFGAFPTHPAPVREETAPVKVPVSNERPAETAPWEEALDDILVPLGSEPRTAGKDRAGGGELESFPTEVAVGKSVTRPAPLTPRRPEPVTPRPPTITPQPGESMRPGDGEWTMSEIEAKVFGLVDDARTVQAIIDLSRLGEFTACQALVSLLRRGLIRLIESRDRAPGPEVGRARGFEVRVPPWLGTIARSAALGLAAGSFVWFLGSTILPLGPLGAEQQARGFPLWSFILRQKVVTVNNALRVYYFEKGRYPQGIGSLVQDGFLSVVDVRSLEGSIEYEGPAKGRVHLVGEEGAGEEVEAGQPDARKPKVLHLDNRRK